MFITGGGDRCVRNPTLRGAGNSPGPEVSRDLCHMKGEWHHTYRGPQAGFLALGSLDTWGPDPSLSRLS